MYNPGIDTIPDISLWWRGTPEGQREIVTVWRVDETDEGRIELIAPDGLSLFTVSKATAVMLGEMLLDVAEDEANDGA